MISTIEIIGDDPPNSSQHTKKAYVSGPNDSDLNSMIVDMMGLSLVSDISNADVIFFSGGADINPKLYGEENHHSFFNDKRDELDLKSWEASKDKPKVGICRGAQFLNVMNGGKLIQHVDGHNFNYRAVYKPSKVGNLPTDKLAVLYEDHHQAIVPYQDAEVIAIAEDGVVEVCFYHTTKSLCFQAHPEWHDEATYDYFNSLVQKFNLI